MATAAQVSAVFETYTTQLEEDSRRLKCVSNIKAVVTAGGPGGQEVSLRLKDIESVAKDISKSLDKFEDALDEDLEALESINEIIAASKQSSAALTELKARTPASMLPKEVDPDSVPSLAEFEAIPKATRLRVPYETCIRALTDIRKVVGLKSKLVNSSTPRSKLSHSKKIDMDEYESRKTDNHGDSVFILESEMKAGATCVFDAGNSTGRAILSTLRALGRIRVVKSGREVTYVLSQPKR